MEVIGWLCAFLALAAFGWGLDRHLRLRDVEISLKTRLGDMLVQRDTALDKICHCCMQSRVLEFKSLIREHFTL
jgi:hypothetical protein